MIETYNKNNKSIQYKIIFKPIKHVYFRSKSDYILITANDKMKVNQVLNILDFNFDKLLKYQLKPKRLTTEKYQLWGQVLSLEQFFGEHANNQKNYETILKTETINQIKNFEKRLSQDLEKLNLTLKPTKVKVLKSKFGSCQIIKKELTINAFLAKLDPVYLYYVLLHEYSHLLVANHSKAFYSLLDQLMPMHKTIQKDLRKYIITF